MAANTTAPQELARLVAEHLQLQAERVPQTDGAMRIEQYERKGLVSQGTTVTFTTTGKVLFLCTDRWDVTRRQTMPADASAEAIAEQFRAWQNLAAHAARPRAARRRGWI